MQSGMAVRTASVGPAEKASAHRVAMGDCAAGSSCRSQLRIAASLTCRTSVLANSSRAAVVTSSSPWDASRSADAGILQGCDCLVHGCLRRSRRHPATDEGVGLDGRYVGPGQRPSGGCERSVPRHLSPRYRAVGHAEPLKLRIRNCQCFLRSYAGSPMKALFAGTWWPPPGPP